MTKDDFKYLRLEGTREALNAYFNSANIFAADEIQGVGRELLKAADLAARIDMPFVVHFDAIKAISSALIGKLVLLHKKSRQNGIKLRYCGMSPTVEETFRKTTRSEGPAG